MAREDADGFTEALGVAAAGRGRGVFHRDGRWPLGDDVLDDLAAIDDFDGTGTGGHKFLVGVDAELVVNGAGEVLDGERVVFGFRAEGVGGAIDHAFLQAAASE